MMLASYFGDIKMVMLLLRANADKDAKGPFEVQSLLLAAERGHPEVVKALLELTSSELKVEVRASAKHLEPQALQQILTPLVSAVESVLSEYPGFVYCRKQ